MPNFSRAWSLLADAIGVTAADTDCIQTPRRRCCRRSWLVKYHDFLGTSFQQLSPQESAAAVAVQDVSADVVMTEMDTEFDRYFPITMLLEGCSQFRYPHSF